MEVNVDNIINSGIEAAIQKTLSLYVIVKLNELQHRGGIPSKSQNIIEFLTGITLQLIS